MDGHEVLVFEIAPAPQAVMLQGDGYPYRVADQVVRMEAPKVAALKERGLVETWEAQRSERTLADLNAAVLRAAINGSRLRVSSADEYLVRRRFAERRGDTLVLRRAAELLFAAEAHTIEHPNAAVRLFRVIGAERRLGAHHNVEELPRFEGNVAAVINDVFRTIQGLLRRPKRLRGLRFEEAPEYPPFAWQEAIVNAVAHRDYAVMGRAIEVWLFDDRMEVTSPGGLVAEVQLEALHQGTRVHVSRNPRLVRGLVDLALMREQGEGIPRMFVEMEIQFLAPPELSATQHQFGVTLRNAPLLDAADAEWLASLQPEGLSEAQGRAMALARIRGQVTNSALREATGLDTLAASAELRDLRDRGLLDLQSAGSAAFYMIGEHARTLAARTQGETRERADGGAAQDAFDRPEIPADRPDLESDLPDPAADRPDLPRDRPNLLLDRAEPTGPAELPPELRAVVAGLGRRPRRPQLREAIQRLCAWRPLRPAELGQILAQRTDNLAKRHLARMVQEGLLERIHPDTPNHPDQAYRTPETNLPDVKGTER